MDNLDFLLIFTTAFLGSVGHCIGMCGGIVVAYTSTKIPPNTPWKTQSISHLAYNLGRVATYTLIGAMFGLLGQVIAFTPTTKGVLFLLTGILMILAGLSLLGQVKFLNSAELSISKQGWYANTFRKLISSPSLSSFFLLGMFNGIIPCGLVYSFAIYAASTASMVSGALVMATFGLATIVPLFFFASVTRLLQSGQIRNTMMKIASILVILYGGFTLTKAYQFIAHPKETQQAIDTMQSGSIKSKLEGKCGGMKCAPGKCG